MLNLSSEQAAADLLSASKRFRSATPGSVPAGVYFNPDLTPDEAKLAFERRKARREQNQSVGQSNTQSSETCS